MEQIPQSPYFPVPVQWFEIPLSTPRLGSGQMERTLNPETQRPASSDKPAPTPAAAYSRGQDVAPSATPAPVGKLLNARA